jgi:hypothetical protein
VAEKTTTGGEIGVRTARDSRRRFGVAEKTTTGGEIGVRTARDSRRRVGVGDEFASGGENGAMARTRQSGDLESMSGAGNFEVSARVMRCKSGTNDS